VLLAWYVHVAAFLAVTPLVGVHLFMATVNRATRKSLPGVFTGDVDAAWAREHHGLEYGAGAEDEPAPPAPSAQRPGSAAKRPAVEGA
jgi:cytochrome b subunit of formate dehydrogenase